MNYDFQGSHALVVDDEVTVARFIGELLRVHGCQVTTFYKSTEALAFYHDQPEEIGLVITDQTMPDMTGIELAQAILERSPDARIIIVSGYSEEINGDVVRNSGISGFLGKPFRSDELLTMAHQLLYESGTPE